MRNDLQIEIARKVLRPSGRELLEGLSVGVPANGFVSILGRSGAGKTTFLRMIAGLDRGFDGHILVGGVPVTGPTRGVQLVFQDYRVLPWRTVLENITFAARDDHGGLGHARSWLGTLGLDGRDADWPKNLSGGELARVALARAFVARPNVLLLDEPFASLDVVTRAEVQDHFLGALRNQPATVILVSHSAADAVLLSDTVYVFGGIPTRVLRRFEIESDRPRLRTDPRVLKTTAQIEDYLHSPEYRSSGTQRANDAEDQRTIAASA